MAYENLKVNTRLYPQVFAVTLNCIIFCGCPNETIPLFFIEKPENKFLTIGSCWTVLEILMDIHWDRNYRCQLILHAKVCCISFDVSFINTCDVLLYAAVLKKTVKDIYQREC